MSTRKAKNKQTQLFELSPNYAGKIDERVTREMRKGVPDEYHEYLLKARTDTDIMVSPKLDKAAKIHVPKLYDILIKHGYTPKNARVVITSDGTPIWTEQYVLKYLPEEAKDQSKRIGGLKSGQVRKEKNEQELKQIEEEIKDVLPNPTKAELNLVKRLRPERRRGLANASKKTRLEVATKGGDTRHEQHPEMNSVNGKHGMYERWGTENILLGQEEFTDIKNAYFKSVETRSDGHGYVMLHLKNGEYEGVEPYLDNNEKTINK